MYPDYRFATADGASIGDAINDQEWNANTFIPTVGKRGAAIIEARGLSSAASAANAAIDHIRDWVLGSNGKWVTMGVPSDGSYGIPEGVIYGVPVICANGSIVYDLAGGRVVSAHTVDAATLARGLGWFSLGLGLTLLFAFATQYARNRVENALVEDVMNRNIDEYAHLYYSDPTRSPDLPVQQMRGYVFTPDRIDRLVNSLVRQLESSGESEIPSKQIGEMVMNALFNLDQVAYVRYASVYKDFREARDFEEFAGTVGEAADK